MQKIGRYSVVGAAAVAITGVLASISPAGAATINVPCAGGGGGASGLRAAVAAANGTPAADTIVLEASCTYTLTVVDSTTTGPNGLQVVFTPITIVGNGATIVRAVGAPPFRLMEVGLGGDLTLQNLTLSGGYADGPG